MKHFFWFLSNIFGYLFGRRFLFNFYHAVINLSLHGLGYDNMFRESWTGEEWFIKKILSPKKPKICLDIGANIGNYTQILLKHTKAKIYAIEPSNSSFEKLGKLITDRVTNIQVAVADFDGEASLYSKTYRDTRASLDRNVSLGEKEEKATVLTIQTIVKKYNIGEIDFVKIDTEGYEREVLKGLGNLRPAFIQFEFNIHHLYRNCTVFEITQLLSGYEFYRLLPRDMIKINPRKFLNNIFMFCNIVAIRKD